jgi:hypothetical protein
VGGSGSKLASIDGKIANPPHFEREEELEAIRVGGARCRMEAENMVIA